MKSGDLVYYRITIRDLNQIRSLFRGFSSIQHNLVAAGDVLPAIVLKAYSTFERVPTEELDGTDWAKHSFSGTADIKVILPGPMDMWLENIEMDEGPTAAPDTLQHGNSLLVWPALGKFTTVEPPALI